MLECIRSFFESNRIEYYSVIDYRDCKETNPHIMERESFTPRSVIMFLLPYYTGETENLSRYAASLDYHIIIRKITSELIECLRAEFPDGSFVGYGDHSPIDECHGAIISGLGVLGDNGLVINEKYGSYVFVADVICDVEPEKLGEVSRYEIRRCEHCGICKSSCPTGILCGKGNDCLSAITQRKGELSDSEITLMKKYNTVWGCDECQSHCPHNKSPKNTPIEFFYLNRIEKLTSEIVDAMDKKELSRRAFGWRGRNTVKRNLEKLNY